MKILHVTPHLGGGVGKAHAAIAPALAGEVEQTFALLEDARDRRFADRIEAAGARVVAAASLDHVATLAETADIVQFEFWNHPRLLECLARCPFPVMRSVFWSHISGLSRPVIAPGLIEQAGRFVFSTEASRAARGMDRLSQGARERLAVINSGFGFAGGPGGARCGNEMPQIAYLGTVDFAKMHPGFFDAVEPLDDDVRVSVWGHVNPSVILRARAMRRADRIVFCGHTDDPESALSGADIFFYPLRRDHYGTAENALIEAMSLGLVPVVLDNPVEAAIVRHGKTGLVAGSIEECASLLRRLLSSPQERDRLAANAIRHVAESCSPARSAAAFVELWGGLLSEPRRLCNFRGIVGQWPADWYLSTQCLPGETWTPADGGGAGRPSKGTLAHFESAFRDDPSLARLAARIHADESDREVERVA